MWHLVKKEKNLLKDVCIPFTLLVLTIKVAFIGSNGVFPFFFLIMCQYKHCLPVFNAWIDKSLGQVMSKYQVSPAPSNVGFVVCLFILIILVNSY